MKLRDSEKIKVTITYEIELEKEELDNYLSEKKSDDEICDDIVINAEEDCVSGSGMHEYDIEGWNGTGWERIGLK
jgi:hypothetical protein